MMRAWGRLSEGALLLAWACSSCSTSNAPNESPDGNAFAGCPVSVPEEGVACSGPDSCLYGSECTGTNAVCAGGPWAIAPAALPEGGDCPVTAPDDEAACHLCGPTTRCVYNATCDAEAGTSERAECVSDVWSVTPILCASDASVDPGKQSDASDAGTDATDGESLASSDAVAPDAGD
jgi:hypothetical protein